MEADIAFGVLGSLEVYREGTPLPLPSNRQRAVLAALLVRRNERVSTDGLIEAAWADELPTNPRSALHTVLSRLRTNLGGSTILNETGGYRLPLDPEMLDSAQFENLCAQAAKAPTAEAVDLLDSALGLWRGHAYSEFSDRDFASAEAVRLDELRLACFEDRAALRLQSGEHEKVAATLGAFLQDNPLRERAIELLMTALYRSGRGTEALQRYREFRRLLAEELGLEPSPALRQLELQILNHDLPDVRATEPPEVSSVRWLATDTAFLGRDDDVTALRDTVREHRLVTLTGVGGVGKTRLAAETLPTLTADPGLPLTVVELRGVNAGHVTAAIAAALGIGGTARIGQATLEYLSITPSLLVLDNCEHLLDGVHSFVSSALGRCPHLRILCTSRHRIGLPEEQVFPVEPLVMPPQASDSRPPELSAAMRLFADRARRVRPSFTFDPADMVAMAELCRHLDGLPLAIELAATRAASLGMEPLLQRLDESLTLLEDDAARGERSLRATLQWSYDLLDDRGRHLFAILGVFEGPFDLEAVESIGADLGVESVAGLLAELVDASLVVRDTASARPSYRLLETVSVFAQECLAATTTESDTRMAHANWVRSMVESAANAVVEPGDATTLIRLENQIRDIQAAVDWAMQNEETLLAGEITGFLTLAFQWAGGLELLNLVREVGDHPVIGTSDGGALPRAAGGFAAALQGDLDAAEDSANKALETATTPDEHFLAFCTLGIVTLYRGDPTASRQWWQQLIEIEGLPKARELHGHASLAIIASYQGAVPEAREHALRGLAASRAGSDGYGSFAEYAEAEVISVEDLNRAAPLFENAIHNAERTGAEFVVGVSSTALVACLTRLGRVDEALEVFAPHLDRLLRLSSWPQLWTSMRLLAELLTMVGKFETAALLLAAADHAPTAPAIAGNDVDRYQELEHSLNERIPSEAQERIQIMAPLLPRAEIVARAQQAVAELRNQ